MSDQLEDRLTQSLAGTPHLKPDEQRRYLGTFRERVSLTLTYDQAQSDFYLARLKDEMLAHPDYQLAIRSDLNETPLNKLLSFASQHDLKTILKADEASQNPSPYVLVLASPSQALHIEVIDVAKKYPQEENSHPKPSHPSFWQKLFD